MKSRVFYFILGNTFLHKSTEEMYLPHYNQKVSFTVEVSYMCYIWKEGSEDWVLSYGCHLLGLQHIVNLLTNVDGQKSILLPPFANSWKLKYAA